MKARKTWSQAFDDWWLDEAVKIQTLNGEHMADYIKRLCEEAWSEGATFVSNDRKETTHD